MKNRNFLLMTVLGIMMIVGFGNKAMGQLPCNSTCGCGSAPCDRYEIDMPTPALTCDIPVIAFTSSAIPPWPFSPPVPDCDTQMTYIYKVWSCNAPCLLSDGTYAGNASISYINKQNCPSLCIEGFAWLGGYTIFATGVITGSATIPCPCCAGGTVTLHSNGLKADCHISTLCDPLCQCAPGNPTGPPAYTYASYYITCP